MGKTTTKPEKRNAKGFIVGRVGFAKISAVEGIQITASMDADFKEFERKKLSAEQRRDVIKRKYGKKG